MAQSWKIVESVPTTDGILELRRRAEGDFLITVGGRILMNSLAHRSEAVLGRLACDHLKKRPNPRVLVGGLGMGYTLRHVLDTLSAGARIVVAELNPVVSSWCRGPLADLTDSAVSDTRVTVEIGDVVHMIQKSAAGGRKLKFDTVVLDLYTGPHPGSHKRDDPLYGSRAIETTRSALTPDGMFAVWGENYDRGFEKRLGAAGFSVSVEQPAGGGPRHVIYLAKLQAAAKKPTVVKSRKRSKNR